MTDTPKRLRRIMTGRMLSLLDALLIVVASAIWNYLREFPDPILREFPNMLLIPLLILMFVLSSFLVLFIYKFHVVNTALLHLQPDFYEQREYSKWWDYYAKQAEKHK